MSSGKDYSGEDYQESRELMTAKNTKIAQARKDQPSAGLASIATLAAST